jgi:xanthine dehydrogenase accessory factor
MRGRSRLATPNSEMKNFYSRIVDLLEAKKTLALATVVEAEGSAPQKAGVSALFSEKRPILGTIGGGLVEARIQAQARPAIKKGRSTISEMMLEDEIYESDGAICGGRVVILLDGRPGRDRETFKSLKNSLSRRRPGILATLIEGPYSEDLAVSRYWLEKDREKAETQASAPPLFWPEIQEMFAGTIVIQTKLVKKKSPATRKDNWIFLERQSPLPRLAIAGAGHVGQAVAHLASLLDFEVTVIDDRPDYANPKRFPEADSIIVEDIGRAVLDFPLDTESYVVIVTRGHAKDAEALRSCIGRKVAYIGMIGSARKVALMRDSFIKNGWATPDEFDRVRAPIGLAIGSKSVEEIAVSIAAELVLARSRRREDERKG